MTLTGVQAKWVSIAETRFTTRLDFRRRADIWLCLPPNHDQAFGSRNFHTLGEIYSKTTPQKRINDLQIKARGGEGHVKLQEMFAMPLAHWYAFKHRLLLMIHSKKQDPNVIAITRGKFKSIRIATHTY